MFSNKLIPNRRPISAISTIGINTLNLKNPWLAACWSFAFPGFGHFYNSNFIFGMLLMSWEVLINYSSKMNLSIFYSLIGDFETAKKVVNLRSFLAYGGLYIFCMWDSYRRSVEMNKQYLLAYENDTNVNSFKMTGMEINYMEKKEPWLAVAWTSIAPGSYVVYLQKLPETIFAIIWIGIVLYGSHLLEAILFSFWGQFSNAKAVLDIQWLLYLPSMYGFIMYKAYENAVEINRIFNFEQSTYLKKEYQPKDFIMPI